MTITAATTPSISEVLKLIFTSGVPCRVAVVTMIIKFSHLTVANCESTIQASNTGFIQHVNYSQKYNHKSTTQHTSKGVIMTFTSDDCYQV